MAWAASAGKARAWSATRTVTVKPSLRNASAMRRVSSLNSAPVSVTGVAPRAASKRARLVRLLEPGTMTSPRTGRVNGVIGNSSGSGIRDGDRRWEGEAGATPRGFCGGPRVVRAV